MAEAYNGRGGSAYNTNVLPSQTNESKAGSNNNLYQGKFEKEFSGDNIPSGMGIAKPANTKDFEDVPGSQQSEQNKLRNREIARYNELASKTFKVVPITNEGIVLDGFGGKVGEEGGYPVLGSQSQQGNAGRPMN